MISHNRRDKNSDILQQSCDRNYQHLWENNFRVLGYSYRFNFKWKTGPTLYIELTFN